MIFGEGMYRYRVVEDWGKLPEGWDFAGSPQPGVSLWSSGGELLTCWGGKDTLEPGNFCIPHAICVDSRGDIYVGDLPGRGMMPTGYNTLQKFARVV